MKRPFYEKLEDVPQSDRDENNYELNQHTGSPHFGKYVLILDPQHPVVVKNTELLSKESVREADKTAAVAAAIAPLQGEVTRLTGELNVAKLQTGLPAGQIAVPADTLTVLNNFKTLGEFTDVKKKVDEYGTLKERDEAATRKTLFSEVAKANGFNEEVFAKLAEPVKLHENLESREIDDGKGNKIKHWFVKGKNEQGAETSVAVADFVKADGNFSPFQNSLVLSEADKKRLPIPNQKHGEPPVDKSPADSYLGSTYKRPDATE